MRHETPSVFFSHSLIFRFSFVYMVAVCPLRNQSVFICFISFISVEVFSVLSVHQRQKGILISLRRPVIKSIGAQLYRNAPRIPADDASRRAAGLDGIGLAAHALR